MTAGQPTGALSTPDDAWHAIDWYRVHRTVWRLQARIVKAVQEGRWGKVRALQYLLTHSFSGKAMAVKRVTSNDGKRTPGVDGVIWDTPEKKACAILRLRQRGYRTQPLRRIYIPKNGSTTRLRPLSIPMGYAYCISLLGVLGIAVAALILVDSLNQLTQYSGLAVADQVDLYQTSSSTLE